MSEDTSLLNADLEGFHCTHTEVKMQVLVIVVFPAFRLSVCGHAIILDVPQNHYGIDIFVTSSSLFICGFDCRQCDCEQEMLEGTNVLRLLECILVDA